MLFRKSGRSTIRLENNLFGCPLSVHAKRFTCLFPVHVTRGKEVCLSVFRTTVSQTKAHIMYGKQTHILYIAIYMAYLVTI